MRREGVPVDDDLIFVRLRSYVAEHGHTAAVLSLRDRLAHPGVFDFWSPEDIWDPSHGVYSVALET